MKTKLSFRILAPLFIGMLLLAPGALTQTSDDQRRQLRDLLRYQRHYNEQLEAVRDRLLKVDEELQLSYSEMVESEELYLEASRSYEDLLANRMATDPKAKKFQVELDRTNEKIRKIGRVP